MTPSHDATHLPTNPIDGLSLQDYVDICQALVRHGGDSARRIEAVLARRDLTPERWALAHAAWTERIRGDPDVRSEFQRRYAAPVPSPLDDAGGNE